MKEFAYRLSLLVIFLIPVGEFINTAFGTASRLGGVLLGGVWLAAVVSSGAFRRLSHFHVATAVFVLWNVASVLWSIDAESSLERFFSYIRMLVLTVILWDLYTSSERVRWGLQTFVLGAYLPVLSTIYNFVMGASQSWTRFSSSGNNANSTAIVIAIAMPIAWHLASSKGEGRSVTALKPFNYAFIPLAVLAVALTGTRFAVVMSVPTLIFCVTTFGRLKPRMRALAFVFLGIALFQVAKVIPEASVERLGSTAEEMVSGDLNSRTVFWREGIQVWSDHPLLGIGANTFPLATPSGRSAHNSFLEILVELGIIGLVLFGIVLTIAVAGVFRQPTSDAYFWLTVFTVWLLGNLPLNFAHTRVTWFLLAFAVASSALPTREPRELVPSEPVAPGTSSPTGVLPHQIGL